MGTILTYVHICDAISNQGFVSLLFIAYLAVGNPSFNMFQFQRLSQRDIDVF